MNPPRIVLRLVSPGKFGSEVAFFPQRSFTFNPFAKIPIAEDLIGRVYRAHAGHGLTRRSTRCPSYGAALRQRAVDPTDSKRRQACGSPLQSR